MSEHRESKADAPLLISDPTEIAELEAENALAQFDLVLDLIDNVVRGRKRFRLSPSTVLDLNRTALIGLSEYAGTFRPVPVHIGGSKHVPPAPHLVPHLIEEMCDWVNDRFSTESALTLCAYIMWRINWIHPFTDGNGRTSRAAAYFVLCCKLGYRLPGRKTVPEQIAENKKPYYDALELVDGAVTAEGVDLTAMVSLLETYLAVQLADTFADAKTSETGGEDGTRKFH